MFMHLPFAKGSATAYGYEGWVRLLSVKFDAEQQAIKEIGKDKGRRKRDVGNGRISEFTISKNLDDASGDLMERVCMGLYQPGCTVKIVICTTDGANAGEAVEFARYELSDAVFINYEMQTGSDNPVEEIKIAYNGAFAQYTPQSSKKSKLAATKIVYEVNP